MFYHRLICDKMDPEFLSKLIGCTMNQVIHYEFGQKEPIQYFSSFDFEEGLSWDSLVFDESIVTLQVFNHDTANEGATKFKSFWPEYIIKLA